MKTSAHLAASTLTALLCLLVVAPTAAAAPLTNGSDSPALLRIERLLDAVPADTASVCSWTSTPGTAQLEAEALQVLDAIADAHFDEFVLHTMQVLGAPEELLTELAAIRNLFTSVAGVVPWEGLLGEQLVFAQTPAEPFLPGVEVPSMVFISRPAADQLPVIERGLSAVLGAFAARMAGPIRYDIERQPELHTNLYTLTLRSEHGEVSLLSIAVVDDTILCGLGQQYFGETLGLLRGADNPRLVDSQRWTAAFGDLPAGTAGRSFLDVPRMVHGLDQLTALIADSAFNGGLWQGLLNETFELAGAVDTVATTSDCQGDRLITKKLTRFADAAPSLVRSGLAMPASGELLEYVPAEVIAFSSRGQVDLDPAWQWTRKRLASEWSAGDDLLWLAELAQATLDLWIDRDLLSWIGSEHLTMTVPSGIGEATETVLISKLASKDGARRCIGRIEGVLGVLLPRLVGGVQKMLAENQVPFDFDVALVPAEGLYPGLKQLRITLGSLPVPSVTYGFLGNLFVATTSERALEQSLAVASGEEDGLWDRELLAEHMGRNDLCTVSLIPVGRQLAETLAGIARAHAMVRGIIGGAVADDPQMSAALDQFTALIDKVTEIMLTVDFLGDAVTVSEIREGGLARFEQTTQALIGFPSQGLSSPLTRR